MGRGAAAAGGECSTTSYLEYLFLILKPEFWQNSRKIIQSFVSKTNNYGANTPPANLGVINSSQLIIFIYFLRSLCLARSLLVVVQ